MNDYLIDTDILSFYLKGNQKVIIKFQDYLSEVDYNGINISEITYFEILAGLEYRNATKQIEFFEKFIQKCNIINLSNTSIRLSAIQYGKLRHKGIIIGTADLLIAGIALANNFTLVTNNQKHFKPVSGLFTANWAE
jgi:tRNA(fMet)-specific endonuclease VapC